MSSSVVRLLQEQGEDINANETDSGTNLSDFWYAGVILYSFGAFCMAAGVVLQKYSINQELKITQDVTQHRAKLRQPLWVLGIIMYGSSGGLLSAALAFAPQSLLTPLMSLVIIFNALLARFLLGEPLTWRDFKCVVVIVVAVILTTSCAPSEEVEKTTDQLIELYKEALFIVFITFLSLAMGALYYVNRVLARKHHLTENEEFVYSFSFGASAGCWGGLCVTMIKSALTIIEDKAKNGGLGSLLQLPLVYGLLFILCLCWYMQLNWINWGLERYPAVFIVSIEAVLNEIVAVLGGILYFKEYEAFTVGRAVGFGFGLLLGIVGIILFSLRDNNVGPEDDYFMNSRHFNCSCCQLEVGSKLRDHHRRRSVKTVVSRGETIYIDENGHEVRLKETDEITFDNVQSPLTLLVDGMAGVAKNTLERVKKKDGDGGSRFTRGLSYVSGGFKRQGTQLSFASFSRTDDNIRYADPEQDDTDRSPPIKKGKTVQSEFESL